ncbi:MAG: hypothetical protein IKY64_02985 [Bacteroidaceae bacterium]|nr:hypothetical protein [Bacteroidaceae bacterium]
MDIGFLNRFEEKIQGELLRVCTSQRMLSGTLLATDDISGFWDTLAPEYVADAVGQIADYPTVSIAWAGYLGLAVAHGWDKNWQECLKTPYKAYYGEQGFDDMDEHIVQHVLGLSLESKEAKALEGVIRSCAQTAVTLIRREQIEPQSAMAFHVFARAIKVMYRIGAALELKRLGYKFEEVQLPPHFGSVAEC